MNSAMNQKDIVLLVSHFVDEVIVHRYKKLLSDLKPEKYDVKILLNAENPLDNIDQ